MYAIKEFKAGPLYYWVWLHNKLKDTGSYAATLAAIPVLMAYKRNLASTAIEALAQLTSKQNATFGSLVEKYGKSASEDRVASDRFRYEARRRIATAWRNRGSLATIVVPLSCYTERGPYIGSDGLLTCNPMGCGDGECSMAPILRTRAHDLVSLREALSKQPPTRENSRRSHALKDLLKKRPITDNVCRSLGDAIFAFFAPSDSIILTTNETHHRPLAEALGKKVDAP